MWEMLVFVWQTFTWKIVLIGGILLGLLILFWPRVVKKDEIGVKYTFEKIGDDPSPPHLKKLFFGYCKSGIHIGPPLLPHCGIARIPKKRFELDFPPRVVVSKPGKRRKKEFQSQFLIVDCAIYTEFNRDFESIKKAVERAVPTDEKELVEVTDGIVDSCIRLAVGSLTWEKAITFRGRERIKEVVQEEIRKESSYFNLGGFNLESTEIRVKTVDLQSQKLKDFLALRDIQRLQKEGAKDESERAKIETGIFGEIVRLLNRKGVKNPDRLAERIHELIVAKDLQKETGQEVVKVIRFETEQGLMADVGRIMTGFNIAKGFPGETKAKTPPEEPPVSRGDIEEIKRQLY